MITVSEEEWQTLHQQLADLQVQLAAAQQRIVEWEMKKRPPASFVKSNRPERAKAT